MRNYQKIRLALFGAATAVIMALIFIFSSQSGAGSKNFSKSLTEKLESLGFNIFSTEIKIDNKETDTKEAEAPAPAGENKAPEKEEDANDENSGFTLTGRKWGHFYLFAALGAAMCLWSLELLCQQRHRKFQAAVLSLSVCLAWACCDEFHQLFVRGRTGTPKDVLYDGAGFGLSIAAVLVIYSIFCTAERSIHRREKN